MRSLHFPPFLKEIKKDIIIIPQQMENLQEYVAHYPSIYFLFLDGDLIYIGKSINLDSRIKEHKKTKEFDKVYFLPIPEHMLESVETALITYFHPPLNTLKKGNITEKDEVLLETFCNIII